MKITAESIGRGFHTEIPRRMDSAWSSPVYIVYCPCSQTSHGNRFLEQAHKIQETQRNHCPTPFLAGKKWLQKGHNTYSCMCLQNSDVIMSYDVKQSSAHHVIKTPGNMQTRPTCYPDVTTTIPNYCWISVITPRIFKGKNTLPLRQPKHAVRVINYVSTNIYA